MPIERASRISLLSLLFTLTITACSGLDPSVFPEAGGSPSDGGALGTGGNAQSAGGVSQVGGGQGTGGSVGVGGSPQTGGAATGGSAAGGVATGGVATGGLATGGYLGTGGAPPTGGAVSTGGSPGSGGSVSSTGGTSGMCSSDSECPNGHCVSGSCVCWDANSIYCSGQCTGILWDNNNCGGCNLACPVTAPRCNAGTCVCDSPPCGPAGTGGAPGTGGAAATGGAPGTGGMPATGGAATGGSPTGGSPTGGSPTGGSPTGGSPTGGSPTGGKATGGSPTGGSPTGGSPTGGTKATGGVAATGGSTNSGGSCGLWTSPSPGSASFTWYYFGQGTYQTNGKYQTACGYLGTESGQTDTVANIVNPNYFAAIPGSNGFNTVDHCGACIKITNGSKSILATIIDECPTDNGANPPCVTTGHLDLSWKAWSDLGYAVGDPSNTTWAYVPCGITSGIVVRFKSNNNNQEIYIENVNIPVKSVTSSTAGAASRTSYGTWHFNSSLAANSTLTLTATNGSVVTITITSTAADTDVHYSQQFPACSG